jgi:dihydrolipoamide dehydrogenase
MEVKVPDIGDFTDVPVIEVLVSAGDEVAEEDPLITLESDKATMDVPAPAAGKITELKVSVGDKVSEGTVILELESSDGASAPAEEEQEEAPAEQEEEPPAPKAEGDVNVQVVVLGAGPGGYSAAFRAADLGLKVALVDDGERLGGVCLNIGCIPSKALLHVARVLEESREVAEAGITFGEPEIDIDKLRGFKDDVVGKLTGGLEQLAKARKVEVVRGRGEFTGPNTLKVSPRGLALSGSNRPEGDSPAGTDTDAGDTVVAFEHAIIAAGSEPAGLPDLPDDPRIMDSTGALEVEEIPGRLLVIGGGIIGLEMATVYDALGSKVTVVELMDQLIPGVDKDLIKVLQKRISGRYENIHLETKVESVSASDKGITVKYGEHEETFDRVLVCVGRRPNGKRVGADKAGVNVTDRGFIEVDDQMRTNVGHIYAIGDVAREPMLAHKAVHEGVLAAEVIAGENVTWDKRSIPSVAYTDPEVAWTGLTETEAKEQEIAFEISTFPWVASGRALSMGRPDGMTKVIVEPDTHRILGAGVVGINAGELIAEIVLAIEMGADSEDVALSVHPHPTLSETVAFSAELAEGTITDLLPKRARTK